MYSYIIPFQLTLVKKLKRYESTKVHSIHLLWLYAFRTAAMKCQCNSNPVP